MVVAIIAVLVAILLPALAAAREQGRAIQCLANLKQIGLAENLYADNYNDILVPSCLNDPPGDAHGWYEAHTILAGVWYRSWLQVQYLSLIKAWTCPSLRPGWQYDGQPRGGGYSVNSNHVHFVNVPWVLNNKPVTRSSLNRASCVLSFTENRTWDFDPDHVYDGRAWPYYAYCPCSASDHNGVALTIQVIARRHNRTNVLFADGHAEGVGYRDIIDNARDIWGHFER